MTGTTEGVPPENADLDALKRNMRAVADYYRCNEGECREMWRCAKGDPDGARRTYDALVQEIEARHCMPADLYLRIGSK